MITPQAFLKGRIKALKNPETYEQMGYMRAHPVLGAVNAVSKMSGGPGITEGFQAGVTSVDPTKLKGYSINLPAMPF